MKFPQPMRLKIARILGLCLAFGVGSLAAEDIVVIVHPSLPIAELKLADVQSYFTGDKKSWPGDLTVKVATQSKALPAFFEEVLKMKESEFKKLWLRLVLQDGAKPPSDFTSDEEVLDYVAKTKGAISYARKSAVTDKVKTLSIK